MGVEKARLGRLLAGRDISSGQRDRFQRKLNVLQAFSAAAASASASSAAGEDEYSDAEAPAGGEGEAAALNDEEGEF